MSLTEKTIQCPICKSPYKTYAFYAGDQSACPSCRRTALYNMDKETADAIDKIKAIANRDMKNAK